MEHGWEGAAAWWRPEAVQKILSYQRFKKVKLLSDSLRQPGTYHHHWMYFTRWFVSPSYIHTSWRAYSCTLWPGSSNCCNWQVTQWVDWQWTQPQIVSRNLYPICQCTQINNTPILLLLDGHGSHETNELRTIAYEHNIFILCFPLQMHLQAPTPQCCGFCPSSTQVVITLWLPHLWKCQHELL